MHVGVGSAMAAISLGQSLGYHGWHEVKELKGTRLCDHPLCVRQALSQPL